MLISNIIGGSNIYPCEGEPLSDQEFVNHIEDYAYIKTIRKRQEYSQCNVHLTQKQTQLLETELRCALLRRKDPCWGYINGKGIRSKCIEGDCSYIKKCNPEFTQQEADYWRLSEEQEQYGNPDKQKKYYLVDLVSEDEMLKYFSDPKGEGREFPPIKDKETKPEKQKIDKRTGRRLTIIGYETTYFGDADDQISPIWGYVDDVKERPLIKIGIGNYGKHVREGATEISLNNHSPVYKREKEPEIKEINIKSQPKAVNAKANKDDENIVAIKASLETSLNSKLSGSYQLTEITKELLEQLLKNSSVELMLENEAELAYVSGTLLTAGVNHEVETTAGNVSISLWKGESKKPETKGTVLVSKTFISKGCSLETLESWKALEKAEQIYELEIAGRDFFAFEIDKEKPRWGCRNLYGATHLAVRKEDMKLTETISGETAITLTKDTSNYLILSKTSAEMLGTTDSSLWEALTALKTEDEISEFPRVISGLVLCNTKLGVAIKGIGHMRFDEY